MVIKRMEHGKNNYGDKVKIFLTITLKQKQKHNYNDLKPEEKNVVF